MTVVANWVAAVSVICCVYLLASWAVLPVDKTSRHYLSLCLTFAVLLMNLGFVIPLAARPDQCYDQITPHSMSSSKICGTSGSLLLLGGWSGVMWVFLRSLSLHLQICWQVLVGRNFMIFSQAAGWGIPLLGITLALVFSGVSFRFGPTCHINHKNSLADVWIPLLIFAGATLLITLATFGYCVKVYLASLYDNSATTEGSSLPAYPNSVRTLSPRQAYRRVRRVVALQWRGIAIVLIIIADVIFFSVTFVFQDNVVQSVKEDPSLAKDWVACLIGARGDKNQCLEHARSIVLSEATVTAVLLLLGLNGIWLMFLLGRISMFTGWYDLFMSFLPMSCRQKEFVSVDARSETKKDLRNSRSYETRSKNSSVVVTPLSLGRSPPSGRQTPDFFGQPAGHHASSATSISSPRASQPASWDPQETFARPERPDQDLKPLGMNRV
ncbi:GPCR, family 2-like protein [Metarhizium album ARSEF 1941]|uniref:GPCR, family 2-like protein n=1 Tax=Metarhizium album (strain ARSEF 1941) TaxID=1081103 RepID=A0A0B2X2P1_METAS|nr:GPCR, family 2-like protein [Metarhizium album ARSEF 1941]KHO00013.1 GPCR, family 2-like protein [Metarhizium album ARSEF 1941]